MALEVKHARHPLISSRSVATSFWGNHFPVDRWFLNYFWDAARLPTSPYPHPTPHPFRGSASHSENQCYRHTVFHIYSLHPAKKQNDQVSFNKSSTLAFVS